MIGGIARHWRAALERGHVRHWGGFVAAGLAALATDIAVLTLLTRLGDASPFLARPFAIAIAIVVSWLINRTITFEAAGPPRLSELARFAGVSATAQAVNYMVFAALLLAFPPLMPELAVVLACLVSMLVSYTGYRYGVFGMAGREGEGPR